MPEMYLIGFQKTAAGWGSQSILSSSVQYSCICLHTIDGENLTVGIGSLDCQFLWVLLIRSQCSANANRLFVHPMNTSICFYKKHGFPSIMDSIILVDIFEKSNHPFIYQTSEHHIPPLHRDRLSSFKSRKGFQGAPSMRGALEHMGAHGTRTCMK